MTGRLRLAALALALGSLAAPLRAECPSHPADLAPGLLGDEMPVPTWTVLGDGLINVQDVLTLLQAAVSARELAWEAPFSEDCPPVPGDLAPGTENGGIWSPDAVDGAVNVSDVLVALRLAVNLIEMDPDYIRPVVADALAGDRVVTGSVVDSVAGAGLPGVTVTAFASESPVGSTLTDGPGDFFLQGLPTGSLLLELDGSTSTAPSGKFSTLQIVVQSDTEGTTSLRTITLADEEDPDGASGKITTDESGTSDAEIDLSNGDGDVGISSGPGGKIETDDGTGGDVDLSATELDGDELPGELEDADTGDSIDGTGAVAVGPADGKFTAGSGLLGLAKGAATTGFDLTLPNRKNFPVGTVVDILYWDGEQGRWLNCTLLNGVVGEVVALPEGGTAVFAPGAATRGGVYAAALPIDPGCVLQVTGRVVDPLGSPLPGVQVDSNLGVLARTDRNGVFFFDQLPAYQLDELGGCEPSDFELVLRGGLPLGNARAVVPVSADGLLPGFPQDLGDLQLDVPDEACVSGLVLQNGVPQSGPVALAGPDMATVFADAQGRFGRRGLAPGPYTFSFRFPGEAFERDFEAELLPRQCTTVRLEVNEGSGARRIEVTVFYDHDDDLLTPGVPANGALVELRGSDAGSSGGLLALAGPSGRVVFEGVNGPFHVLAVLDVEVPDPFLPPGEPVPFFRTGASLTTNALPTNRIGLMLAPAGETPYEDAPGFIHGEVTGLPAPGPDEVFTVSPLRRGALDFTGFGGFVDPMTGAYSAPAYTVPFDLGVGRFDNATFPPRPLELGFFGPFQAPEPMNEFDVPEIMQDLDWSTANPLHFDRTLPLTYSNFLTSSNDKYLDLFGRASDGRGFTTPLAMLSGIGQPPASAEVPDPESAGGLPWRLHVEVASEAPYPEFAAQFCIVPLPSPLPGSLNIPFLVPPDLNGFSLAPSASLAQVLSTPIDFDTPGPTPPNGFDALAYFSYPLAPGPGQPSSTLFVIYLPPSTLQQALIPPTPRPLLFPDSDLYVQVQSIRATGLPAAFETLFDDRVSEHFEAIVDSTTPSCASDDNRLTYIEP